MLVDNVTLIIKAGNGGNGAVSFKRNAQTAKGGPNGGNGGNGGNIYFQGSNNVGDLAEFRFKKKISAQDGVSGGRNNLYGKNAPHTTIFVPLGTQITEADTNKVWEITQISIPVLLARGGKGGRGNNAFKSSTNQTPRFAEKGAQGEGKTLFLELRLIADIGLIGLPNAGKSSLLSVLTHAKPKIANYPFTTLDPNIGMLGKYAIADIPGLIEGASSGKGLGIKFLKHIEKTRLLVHCIEASDKTSKKTYEIVRNEFGKYNSLLLQKPEIVVLTKADIADEITLKENLNAFKKMKKKVFACSIYSPESIQVLKQTLII